MGIAQALAVLTRLRRQQDPNPGHAERRARPDIEATITARVRALEAYAARVQAAAPSHQQAATSLAAPGPARLRRPPHPHRTLHARHRTLPQPTPPRRLTNWDKRKGIKAGGLRYGFVSRIRHATGHPPARTTAPSAPRTQQASPEPGSSSHRRPEPGLQAAAHRPRPGLRFTPGRLRAAGRTPSSQCILTTAPNR